MKKEITILWMLLMVFSITKSQTDVSSVLEDALSSVVSVGVFKVEGTKQELGYRGPSDVAYQKGLDLSDAWSKGSGFIIDVNGKKYVCTNAHVVEMAKAESGAIYVFSISRKKYEVKIKGGDSFYDYAILEFVDQPGAEVTAIKYTTDEARIGEKVYAIGNPLAEYPYTVSDGIVSAKNRVRDGVTGKYGFIQSTATIIWGNSGGPLVNEKGEVIGMNSQIAFGPEDHGSLWQPQINFALDAKICRRLTDDIINNNGRVRRAFLGVEVSQNFKSELDYYTQKTVLKKDDAIPLITNVFYNSPASAVLSSKIGYELYKVNGVETRTIDEVLGEFESIKPNSKVTLTIGKNGSTENVSFSATELQPTMMAHLARSMVQNDPNYKLTGNGEGVTIAFKQAYNNYYENRYNTHLAANSEFTVVGVGEVSDNNSEVWRVSSLAELGVGIRFYGLDGYYDLVTLDKSNPNAQPKSTRVYLSGDQNIFKHTLWY